MYSQQTSLNLVSQYNTLLATYADDTAILSSSSNPILASAELQDHANKIEELAKEWKIKINTEKSVQVTFTLKHFHVSALN
jgi:ABC-type uncharacterized transport system ATPase subunit